MAKNGRNGTIAILKEITPTIERKMVKVVASSSFIGEIAKIMPKIGEDKISLGLGAHGKVSFRLPLEKYSLFVANLICGGQAEGDAAAFLAALEGISAKVARKCVEVSAATWALDALFEAIKKSLPRGKSEVTMSIGAEDKASFKLGIEEYTLLVANLLCSAKPAQPVLTADDVVAASVPVDEQPVPVPGAAAAEPKKMGRKPYLTEEQKEENRRVYNRNYYALKHPKKDEGAPAPDAEPEEEASREVPAGTGKPDRRRFRSLASGEIIEGPVLGADAIKSAKEATAGGAGATVVPGAGSQKDLIAAIKDVKKHARDAKGEVEAQLDEAVRKLAARALPLANKRKSARLMKNLPASELPGIIDAVCRGAGVQPNIQAKNLPANLYFDRELLGGILKAFALKAAQNVLARKSDTTEVHGSIAAAEEKGKIIIVMRNISNGVHMHGSGEFVRLTKSRFGTVPMKRKHMAAASTHGPLDQRQATVFNKALELLGAERYAVADDGVKLVVPGEERHPGRKPAKKEGQQPKA